jgi:uncharacterized protein YaeQ
VALTATIYTFTIDLADHDRGAYETLDLRVARHPSEADEYMIARVLAYCLEYEDGIAFTRGVSTPDEPAIVVRDLTGALRAWIEVGTPEAARLHKAGKASPRVAVYVHKDPAQWRRTLSAERIHRSAELAIHEIDRGLVSALVARLERRMAFTLSVSDRELHVSIGDDTLTGTIAPIAI